METELRGLLDELRSAAAQAHDEGDRAELMRLVEAVEQRLESDAPREHHLAEGLRSASARFEADHPVLGAALRRAVDALSAAGI
ncbi:MAG: DUF4404 family protein [Acidimicrobiia bacterium]